MTKIFRAVGLIFSHLRAALRRSARATGAAQATRLADDNPLIEALHRTLAKRTGTLRVADAYRICGLKPGKASQVQISQFARAIRALGWERQRRRLNGSLQYVYVRGS